MKKLASIDAEHNLRIALGIIDTFNQAHRLSMPDRMIALLAIMERVHKTLNELSDELPSPLNAKT